MTQPAKTWDIGAGGAVIADAGVLLVRRTYGVGKGMWALPGGFAEHEELLDQTAVREVYEETGVRAAVIGLIGMRTRVTAEGGAVYAVFSMRPLDGIPTPDGHEVDAARYFSVAEVNALSDQEIFPLSRTVALAALRGSPGLIETPSAATSSLGPSYRAFIAP